jgi:hypothetical protein
MSAGNLRLELILKLEKTGGCSDFIFLFFYCPSLGIKPPSSDGKRL